MSLLIISPSRETDSWVKAIQSIDSKIEISVYPQKVDKDKVEFVLCWNPPINILNTFPNLKCICSMGAGVDFLLKDKTLSNQSSILRIVDPELSQIMFEFILAMVMDHLRGLTTYRQNQEINLWKPESYKRIRDVRIGIMGMGKIGNYVAEYLVDLGFSVNGWSLSPKIQSRATNYIGNKGLSEFMQNSDILVCLLPSTPETRQLLNKETLSLLPIGSSLINVARGDILKEDDLVELLDNGHLTKASLDVFINEPLDKNHAFWKHKKINISPHTASITNPASVAQQIVQNYHKMKKGEELLNMVSREKGY